ncbi:hypothetical protein K9M16_02890 [Candidatus Babeliales bacterium]|nr:hypothetical protein [Candidatus Babeliales bacterium]
MKHNNKILIFFIAFLFFFKSYPSIDIAGFTVEIKDFQNEDDLKDPRVVAMLEGDEKLKKDSESGKTRYLEIQTTGDDIITFDKTAFYNANYFYLGADSASATTSTLMRAYLVAGATPSQNQLLLKTMAPQQVYLNGIQEDNKYVKKTNPIWNNRISFMSLMDRTPIVVLSDATNVDIIGGTVPFGDNQLVCLVQDYDNGDSVTTIAAKLEDADGNESSGIAGVAGSSSNIFVAVRPSESEPQTNFGAEKSVFSMLSKDNNTSLKFVNKVELDLTANTLFAITQAADVGGLGDMYWDSTLQRLFIGLSSAGRSNTINAGGLVSVLVGRVENNNLVIESSINLNSTYFTENTDTYGVGFYHTDNSGVQNSIDKIRTMHTSTGYTYLIINGGVYELGVATKTNIITALPLVQNSSTVANIGKIAKKGDFTTPVAAQTDMTEEIDSAAQVGTETLPIPDGILVQDLFVSGDSVFACLSDNRSAANREAGIFKSTALFDEDGHIRGWTPWQRVLGNIDKVYGAGFDSSTGNYWYLTTEAGTTDKNTAKVTQWGKSVEKDYLMGNGLVDILHDEFKQENAGVHQIFNFDEQTPGFLADQFSMMVATGYQKLALIQTGEGTPLEPTKKFEKDGVSQNVFINEDDVIKNLGPICCAEVSRITGIDNGWLFVGGYNGIAVLRKADGTGWDGAAGLNALTNIDFPGSTAWSFKLLTNNSSNAFTKVRKIISQGNSEFLYVMTADKLYRFAMTNAKFADGFAGALDMQEISITNLGTPLDFLIIQRDNTVGAGYIKILIATTEGLFYSDNIIDAQTGAINPTWTNVTLATGTNVPGPVAHLDFLSTTKGGSTIDGNLYILNSNFAFNLANIYRFNVSNGTISHITEKSGSYAYYQIGELRNDFKTDGALGFYSRSKHLGDTNFLKKIKMLSSPTTIRSSESVINLDLDSDAYNIGVMTQNTASGAWIVPGDWGIRVND